MFNKFEKQSQPTRRLKKMKTKLLQTLKNRQNYLICKKMWKIKKIKVVAGKI